MTPLTYESDSTAMIVGVGLMGQYLANRCPEWLGLSKLVLVDHADTLKIGGNDISLSEYAETIASENINLEVVAETIDITSEQEVKGLFRRHPNVRYYQHTAGISPKPLTPPEELSKEDILGACEVNLWGAHNVLKQGIKAAAFAPRTHGVIILSTSATVGSEGRASAAYEESKGGLMNLLTLQARYFLEEYGLLLNGIAPSPLRGIMAAQNPTSAARLQAVEDSMPIGGLTEPKHIAAATMYFWSNECWCVGEVVTTDGGYTKHKPIYDKIS
ncbi:MAG: SDR family oxidoreductase [Gammaproteobacteria bacterium TMED1]|nr:MAG: SDR family oxidoreductase [Gammaproteobacteria bacterium TMED1]